MVPAAARSARIGSGHSGTKRKKLTIGSSRCSNRSARSPCSPLPVAMTVSFCMAWLPRAPIAADADLARIDGIGGGGADGAEARAFAADADLARIGYGCRRRTDLYCCLRLVLLHDHLQQKNVTGGVGRQPRLRD